MQPFFIDQLKRPTTLFATMVPPMKQAARKDASSRPVDVSELRPATFLQGHHNGSNEKDSPGLLSTESIGSSRKKPC
jgi:hypothetical protein